MEMMRLAISAARKAERARIPASISPRLHTFCRLRISYISSRRLLISEGDLPFQMLLYFRFAVAGYHRARYHDVYWRGFPAPAAYFSRHTRFLSRFQPRFAAQHNTHPRRGT